MTVIKIYNHLLCYMAVLVFPSVRKIMHADCFLNSARFYNIGLVQYAFYFRTGMFWWENLRPNLNEIYGELSTTLTNLTQ